MVCECPGCPACTRDWDGYCLHKQNMPMSNQCDHCYYWKLDEIKREEATEA